MTQEDQHEKLRSTLSDILGVPAGEINDETSPDVVPNWDSVMVLNLVLALEEAYQISLSPEEMLEMTSVRSIKELLEAKGC